MAFFFYTIGNDFYFHCFCMWFFFIILEFLVSLLESKQKIKKCIFVCSNLQMIFPQDKHTRTYINNGDESRVYRTLSRVRTENCKSVKVTLVFARSIRVDCALNGWWEMRRAVYAPMRNCKWTQSQTIVNLCVCVCSVTRANEIKSWLLFHTSYRSNKTAENSI